jgi:hypothetical protein
VRTDGVSIEVIALPANVITSIRGEQERTYRGWLKRASCLAQAGVGAGRGDEKLPEMTSGKRANPNISPAG